MSSGLKITRIVVTDFAYEIADRALEAQYGLDSVYTPGSTLSATASVLRIEADSGNYGEAPGLTRLPGTIDGKTAAYLLGRDPLQREAIWHDLKRARRTHDATPPSQVDIALWDLAGRLTDMPIHRMLGGWRTALPAYASTPHGDENGGLSTPDDYAAFAAHCNSIGYAGFKIHGWIGAPIEREVAAVLAIREAVGHEMDLMLDPAGAYQTFSDVLKVGRACDRAEYLWYEDPFRGGGFSNLAHAKLREIIKTPLLMGEHIRGLEAKMDSIHAGAADYMRANAHWDGGITGVMKIATMAEACGLDVELHGGGLVHRQCMAAIRNTNYYELAAHPKLSTGGLPVYVDPRWREGMDAVDASGNVAVPDGPGLGAELDWDYIDGRTTGQRAYE
jgi:L-alanine-DL-glutamate epimerase-like enolase superfamily enzyme